MSKLFYGETWRSNEYDDGIPSLCFIEFSDDSLKQIRAAKKCLRDLAGMGVNEIKLIPLCNIEWRDHFLADEINSVKSGDAMTNMDISNLGNYLREDDSDELDEFCGSSIRGESLSVTDHSVWVSAYNKYSDTIVEVQSIPIDLLLGNAGIDEAIELPTFPSFDYLVKAHEVNLES